MGELIWHPHKGWGFEDGEFDYGEGYWHEFLAKQETRVGKVLTTLRKHLVLKHTPRHSIVDIGIGGGAFVEAMNCEGFDVNPRAISWLEQRDALWDQDEAVGAMTMWDSLEHIRDPGELLQQASWVFISTPIYDSAEHCIHSKHYKPGEHLWYFTDIGLKRFMAELGFGLIEQNRMEESVGRKDIGTYVFSRVC